MTTNLNWQQALKEFNSRRKEEGGKHIIPKKGTEDYVAVRKLMGDTDAKPMVPDQPVKEQIKPKRSNSKSKELKELEKSKPEQPALSPSELKELVEGGLPTLEKPLWVDEPKPSSNKKKAKKDVATQTEPQPESPPEPQPETPPEVKVKSVKAKKAKLLSPM